MSLQSKIISFRGKIEKIFSNKVVLGTLAVVLLGGVVFGAVKWARASAENNAATIYAGEHISYGWYNGAPYETTLFTVKNETTGETHEATCAQPTLATPNSSPATIYDPANWDFSNGRMSASERASALNQIKRVLLVSNRSYDSTIFDKFDSDNAGFWNRLARYDDEINGYDDEDVRAYTLGHVLVSKLYTAEYDFVDSYEDKLDEALATINSWFESKYPDLSQYNVFVAELNSDAGGSSYQEVIWVEAPDIQTTKIRLRKRDASTSTNLDGAEFTFYKRGDSDTDQAEVIARNVQTGTANGGSAAGYTKYFDGLEMNGDRYCFVETEEPLGYYRNTKPVCTKALTVANYPNYEDGILLKMSNTPEEIPEPAYGTIKIQKQDSETGNTPQGEADLAGAQFTVYDASGAEADVITIGLMDGIYVGESATLLEGSYTIKETKAGTGYLLNEDWEGTCTISASNDSCEFVGNQSVNNTVIKAGFSIVKIDSEDNHKMAGVEYHLYDGKYTSKNEPSGVEPLDIRIVTDNNGEYTLPEDKYLPYGRYTLYEVANAANAGYTLMAPRAFWMGKHGNLTIRPLETFTNVPNEGSEFSTSLTEATTGGRSVGITSDVDLVDRISFTAGHLPLSGRTYRFVYELYGQKAGENTWARINLANSNTSAMLGSALASGYTINFNDIDTTEFAGGKISATIKLQYRANGAWIDVMTHNADHAEATEMVTVEDPEYSLSSEACRIGTSGGSCKKDLGMGQTGVADSVEVRGLVSGHSYLVKARAVCFSEGATSGTTLAEQDSATINATSETTSTTIELSFDSATCGAGKKVGIQNQLFEVVNGSVSSAALAEHNMNLSVANQTVTILTPTVTTTATSGGAKVVALNATAKIQDKVEYTGLVQGTQYCLVGKLMNGTTEIASVGSDTFNATGETGTYDMEFTFNSEALEGKTLLVNEYLYRGACGTGTLIAKHENGTNQTVTVTERTPWIGTKASAQGGETNLLQPTTGQVIIDKVQYRNLKVGQKYTLFGDLMKSATEKFSTATSGVKLVFTAEARDGEISVTFPAIDATNLAGQTLVVFERLYQGELGSETGTPVAKHEDFSDGNQAVVVKPKVGTKVAEEQSGLAKVGIGNAFIIDTVKYEGLEMGKTYTAKGWLVDAAGQKIAGSEGTKQFTIGEGDTPRTSGEVKVKMALRTVGLGGKKVVAYEEVYLGSTVIADHKDINDPSQTLDVEDPAVGTSAKDKVDGDQELATSSEAVIVDTVNYKGLVIGSEYCVRGTLMDKESEKAVTVTNGENVGNIESSACFKAERTEGSVDMEFKFDATNYGGKVFVVFETLYLVEADASTESGKKETEIAKHHNINDTAQTVTVKLNPPETGMSTKDDSGAKLVFGSAATIVMGMAGYGIYLARSKKKYNAE